MKFECRKCCGDGAKPCKLKIPKTGFSKKEVKDALTVCPYLTRSFDPDDRDVKPVERIKKAEWKRVKK